MKDFVDTLAKMPEMTDAANMADVFNGYIRRSESKAELAPGKPMTRIQAAILLVTSSEARILLSGEPRNGFDAAICYLQEAWMNHCPAVSGTNNTIRQALLNSTWAS